MNSIMRFAVLIAAIIALSSCANFKLNVDDEHQQWRSQSLPDKTLDYKVYLIGDAGGSIPGHCTATLQLLKQELETASENSAVIFLGGNALPIDLPGGLPPKDDKYRETAEAALVAELDILKNYPGRVFVLPGNDDWQVDGVDGVRRMEEFVEDYLNRGNTFVPDNGCSGPEIEELTDKLGLMAVDSEWFLTNWDDEAEINEDCEIRSKAGFLAAMKDEVRDFRGKNLLIVGHHPLFSAGWNGNNFSWKDHIFPMSNANPLKFIPLPVIGSFVVAVNSLVANRQEIAHPIYDDYIGVIKDAARVHGNVIYAAGHEHNQQLSFKKEISHIVSGAGSCDVTPIKLGKYADMAYATNGFSVIHFYDDGEAWVEFIKPKDNQKYVATPVENKDAAETLLASIDSSTKFTNNLPFDREGLSRLTAEVFYRQKIKDPLPTEEELTPEVFPEYEKGLDSVEVSILEKGDIWEMNDFFWGKLYTEYYFRDLKFPVLDLENYAGGLEAFKRGGGFQTKSIRLINDDETRLYQIRKMRKSADKLFYPLNKTFVKKILEHSYTSSNPFGAYLLKPMEDAIGIYHTNPHLVYVPKQPRLGRYNEYAGALFHLEERPDEDWSDLYSFGYSKNIVSTGKLLEERIESDDAVIDQSMMLRCRLFDLIIGDWDRHPDQWRWSTQPIEGSDRILYQPIPRDRDQAFSKYGGMVFYAGRLVVPFLRTASAYDDKINRWEAKWLPYQSRDVDEFFLNELTWEDWEKEVEHVQKNLTDESIEQGVSWLPEGIYQEMAPELKKNIKARRDDLLQTAKWWYKNLAKTVTVVATQKENYTLVERQKKHTKVTIYELEDDDKKEKIYERTFDNKMTKEIRLFGLEGDDQFEVVGKAGKKSPIVRLIGGVDEDTFNDKSKVNGWGRKTIVHDDKIEDNKVEPSREIKDKRMNDYKRNTWVFRDNPKSYSTGLPILGSTPDDGLYTGLHLTFHRFGYHNESVHNLSGKIAWATRGFHFKYEGDFKAAIKDKDLLVQAATETPRYVNNFFGYGNETSFNDEVTRRYYRVQKEHYKLYIGIKEDSESGTYFTIGPMAEIIKINRINNSFLQDNASLIRPEVFGYQYFAGARATFNYTNIERRYNPEKGVDFQSSISWQTNLEDVGRNFANFNTSLALYLPFDKNSILVWATKFGINHNFGQYDFFHSPNLGGNKAAGINGSEFLRGFAAQRFTGRTAFFQSNELRWSVLNRKKTGLPLSIGIAPAFDYGRVWADNEKSSTWHYGYGGSVWVAPLDYVSFSFGLMKTIEGSRFTTALGFDF
ncbi:MAG: hypothetical protein R2825_05755 [Saprospiraceae bacterium]